MIGSQAAADNTTIRLEATQPVPARSEPPPLTWILFFCALRAAAALLAGILYALAAPNDTVRARMHHTASLSPAAQARG